MTAALALSVWTGCSASGQSDSSGQSVSATSLEDSTDSESTSVSAAGHYPVTVSNFNYAKEPVEFTYEKASERVITFWSNSLETLLALGLGNRIICVVGMNEEETPPELQGELAQCTQSMEYCSDFKDSNAALSKEPP